nr:O-antigen ligase family protein [uncultured Allomuricauda sp.]
MSAKLSQASHEKLCTWLLALALLLLLTSLAASNIGLILFLFVIILRYPSAKVFFAPSRLGWIFVTVFLFHVISFFWTDQVHRYLPFLERNLSWVLFPLLLSENIKKRIDLDLFKKTIFFGLVFFALINEAFIIFDFVTTDVHEKTVRLFFSRYYQLGNAIRISDIHYPYLSLYNTIGLVFGLSILNRAKRSILATVGILILLFYNFQLGSRVFFVINFLFVFYTCVVIFLDGSKYLRMMLAGVLIAVFWFAKPILAHSYSRFVSRIEATFESRNAPSEFYRPDRWKMSADLIRENLFLGLGPADVENELQIKYLENNFKISVSEKYNTHNQYLDYLLRFGILGGILLISILGIILYNAYVNKNYEAMIIFLVFSIAMITENYLSVQRGIVPFCLLSILLNKQPPKANNN